jgi:hypothetical protein
VAPVFGDVLSTATAPLDLLLPWNLALFVALYGCGALLCREVARRLDLPFRGLCLLGAAYGVYEEALVDRFWFDAGYWDEGGIGSYGVVWHTNVLIATHLTVFHTAVSVVASVLVVERLFPEHRGRPWVGGRSLVVAGLALAATVPLLAEAFPWPPLPVVGASVALVVALVALAVGTRRSAGQPNDAPAPPPAPRRRAVGLAGRYDLTIVALAVGYGLRRLLRSPSPAAVA